MRYMMGMLVLFIPLKGENKSVQFCWDTSPGSRDHSFWVDMSTLIPVWRLLQIQENTIQSRV